MSYPNVLNDIQQINSKFSNYLPLGGGVAFKGNLPLADGVNYFMRKLNNNEFITFYGGSDWGYGGGLFLRGQDNDSNTAFELWSCRDKSNLKKLYADYDGNLYWNGMITINTSSSAIRMGGSNTELQIRGGNSNDLTDGSGLILYGKDHSSYAGQFNLYGIDENGTRRMLIFQKDGRLTWDGHNVVTVTSHYQSGTRFCRIYSDGWKEQGGWVSTDSSFTWSTPFKDNNYTVTAIGQTTSSYNAQYRQICITEKTATYIKGTIASGVGLHLYACGY